MADERQRCLGDCGKDKKITDFYASNSEFHKHNGKLHVCKDCFIKYINEDINKLKNALRMIDRPFLIELLKASQDEVEKTGKTVIGTYMKNLGLAQNRGLTWDDSDFEGYIGSKLIDSNMYDSNDDAIEEILDEDIDKEVRQRWIGYIDIKDVIFLENFYQELINTYESKTPMQRNIYKNMAETQLLANEARSQGKIKEYQDLLKTMSTLMTDAKIKPLQDTGEQDGGLSTWGQWIKKIEETEPIPEAKDEFKDVDGIGKYINKWFTSHFAKVFGLSDNSIVKADDIIDTDGDKNGRL